MDGIFFEPTELSGTEASEAAGPTDVKVICDLLYANEIERLTPISDAGKGYKVGSFFTGVGALDMAVSRFGATTIVAAETKPLARKWFQANFGTENPDLFRDDRFLGDVTAIDPKSLPHFDLLVAGPPCQPFSRIGNGLGFSDPRGSMINYVADIVAGVRPQAFLIENADSLMTHDGGRTLTAIIGMFEGHGYDIRYSILEASEFGAAATRKRLYLIGFDKLLGGAEGFVFPRGVERRLTMSHIFNGNCDLDVGYTVRASGLHGTIGESHNHDCYLVDGQAVRLTARQAARCMGYPDEFLLPESRGEGYDLVGNSVALPVVYALLRQVFTHLRQLDAAVPCPRTSKPNSRRTATARKPRGKKTTSLVMTAEVAAEVRVVADEIRGLQRQRTSAAIGVGKRLAQIKARLPHGSWQPFLKSSFALTATMARNWMAVARMFGEREGEIERSGLSDTTLLAISRAPEDMIESLLGRAIGGEQFTVCKIKNEIKKARGGDAAVPVPDFAGDLTRSLRPWVRADAAEVVAELTGLASQVVEAADRADQGKPHMAATARKAFEAAVETALRKVCRVSGIDVLHTASSRSGNTRIVKDLHGGIGSVVAAFVDLRHGADARRTVACRNALRTAGFLPTS